MKGDMDLHVDPPDAPSVILSNPEINFLLDPASYTDKTWILGPPYMVAPNSREPTGRYKNPNYQVSLQEAGKRP